jgi:hypothetical protein
MTAELSDYIKQHEPMIRLHYPTTENWVLAQKMGLSERAVGQIAWKLQIKKCPVFKRMKRSDKTKRLHEAGIYKTSTRYLKGPAKKLAAKLFQNKEALMQSGMAHLADLTGTIIDMIESTNNMKFDFLTIVKKEWE